MADQAQPLTDDLVQALSPTYVTDSLRALSPALDKMSDLEMLQALHQNEAPNTPFQDYVRGLGINGFNQKGAWDTGLHNVLNGATLGLGDPAMAAAKAGASTPFDPGGISSAIGASQFAKWLKDQTGIQIGLDNGQLGAQPGDSIDPSIATNRSGATFDDMYNQNRRTQALENDQGATDNPFSNFAGNVGGYMLGLGPLSRATEALGAARFGDGVLGKAALDSSVQGAGSGGINAFQNGQDVGNGAAIGAGLGYFAPAFGDAIVKGANGIGKGLEYGGGALQSGISAIASIPRTVIDAIAAHNPSFAGVKSALDTADTAAGKLLPSGIAQGIGNAEGRTAGIIDQASGLPGSESLFGDGLGMLSPGIIPYAKAAGLKYLGQGIQGLTDPDAWGTEAGGIAKALGYDADATSQAVSSGLTQIDRSTSQDLLQNRLDNVHNPSYAVPSQSVSDPSGFVQSINEKNPGAGQKLQAAYDAGPDAYKQAVFSLMNSPYGQAAYSPNFAGTALGGFAGYGIGSLVGGLTGIGEGLGGIAAGYNAGGFLGGRLGGSLGGDLQSALSSGANSIGSIPGEIKDSITGDATAATNAVQNARSNPQQFLQSLVKVHPQLAQVLGQAYQQNPDKYEAMLFSASQNPQYRQSLIAAHQLSQNSVPNQ